MRLSTPDTVRVSSERSDTSRKEDQKFKRLGFDMDDVESQYAASILNLKSQPSFVDYTGEVTWTRSDRVCLNSLNDMHYMSRKHHATAHAYDRYSNTGMGMALGIPRPGDVVAYFTLCDDPSKPNSSSASSSAAAGSASDTSPRGSYADRVVPVKFKDMDEALGEYKVPKNGLLWVHIKDIRCLRQICRRYSMHSAIELCFQDIRAHSSIVEAHHSFLVSLCGYWINPITSKAVNSKLSFYVADGLLVSLERDVIPAGDYINSQSPGIVFETVIRHIDQAFPRYCEYGVGYLAYDLITGSLELQNPLLEFCYRCVLYHKQRLLSMSERESAIVNALMHCKVGVLEAIMIMLERQSAEGMRVVAKLSELCADGSDGCYLDMQTAVAEDSYSGSWALSPSFLSAEAGALGRGAAAAGNGRGVPDLVRMLTKGGTVDSRPFLMAAADSYKFFVSCLRNELMEAGALHQDMKYISSFRSSRTSVILSLVATVFLPMTFLTGVFGMNFEEGAHYSIPMLNSPDGPFYFCAMCVALVVLSRMYFVSKGWVEPMYDFSSIWNILCCRESRYKWGEDSGHESGSEAGDKEWDEYHQELHIHSGNDTRHGFAIRNRTATGSLAAPMQHSYSMMTTSSRSVFTDSGRDEKALEPSIDIEGGSGGGGGGHHRELQSATMAGALTRLFSGLRSASQSSESPRRSLLRDSGKERLRYASIPYGSG